MTFLQYLKSKQLLIIIWLTVHVIALFVNFFEIEGMSEPTVQEYTEQRNDGVYPGFYEVRKERYSRAFTTVRGFAHNKESNTPYFWPFVKFVEKNDYLTSGGYQKYFETHSTSFNGIFYSYDFSEFIAYSGLLLLVLYFLWTKKYATAKPQTKQP